MTIECLSPATWVRFASQHGFPPDGELGYVEVSVLVSGDGKLSAPTVATINQLAPATCTPLQLYASAAVKPTKCTPAARRTAGPVPCYQNGVAMASVSPSYWTRYQQIADAMGLSLSAVEARIHRAKKRLMSVRALDSLKAWAAA